MSADGSFFKPPGLAIGIALWIVYLIASPYFCEGKRTALPAATESATPIPLHNPVNDEAEVRAYLDFVCEQICEAFEGCVSVQYDHKNGKGTLQCLDGTDISYERISYDE